MSEVPLERFGVRAHTCIVCRDSRLCRVYRDSGVPPVVVARRNGEVATNDTYRSNSLTGNRLPLGP